MSQASLTFLSQSSNTIFHPPKKEGGTGAFQAGIAGSLTRKHLVKDVEEATRRDIASGAKDDGNDMSLSKYHYSTAVALAEDRKRLGVLDMPPKPVGSIPGYSGFVPRKEAANVIGTTYKNGNMVASELFAVEQEAIRSLAANIKGPCSDLSTPHTGDY